MGAWGVKLYQDDLAEDVRDEYKEKLKNGKSNKETLEEILEKYSEEKEDYDDGPVFWMALADTMWNLGRLTKEVKERAIKEIEKGNNLKKWKEEATEKEYKQREKEIEKLKEKLKMPMPEEKVIKQVKKAEKPKESFWKIGDTYAYKLEGNDAEKLGLKGRYIIFRKVADYEEETIRTVGAVVYAQITERNKLPKNKEEIEKSEYIIIGNEGNIKYKYLLKLLVPRKTMKEKFIYLGNFLDMITPKNEYEINYWPQLFLWKEIENSIFLRKIINLGTNINPVYREINPENVSDSKIRFLMRVEYYKKVLGIKPPPGAIVKDDPLLYIALVDSLMIGGWVNNPVKMRVEDMREETYKRIEILKEKIKQQDEEESKKEERIKILEELKNKVENYETTDIFSKLLRGMYD